MRALLLVTACAVLAHTATAAEPVVPKNLNRPMTAYATAKTDGKKIAVTLKIVETATEVRTAKKTVFETVEKDVNGKKVVEQVPVERVYQFSVQVPKGFREVRLFAADVKARDTAGNPVGAKKLTEALASETPVLLTTSPDPVDPFHLLTTKEGTIILHIDGQKLAPPADPVPPKGVPPIPTPQREPSAPGLTKFLTDNKCSFFIEGPSSGAVVAVPAGAAVPAGPCRVVIAELGEVTDAKLKAFAAAAATPATVERVYFTGTFTAAALRELCRVKSIRDFGCSVRNPDLKPADFACLGQLPDLTHVNIGDLPNSGDELLGILRDYKSLRVLMLNDCDVTDAGLARAAGMKLESLYVNSPQLTPAAWNSVAKLPDLASLELIRCPKLTGAGLAKVKNLPLRILKLRQAGVADVDMPLVAGIPTLTEVRLPENAITDAGLQHLAGLKLTLLDVRQTKVTAAGVQKLSASLPACRIEWDGGAIEPRK